MKLSEQTKRNLSQYSGLLMLFLIVAYLGVLKNKKPKYEETNSALSYIWDKVEGTQRIELDSVSYVYVSAILDNQRIIQIINFKSTAQEGDEFRFKETKIGWIDEKSLPPKEDLIRTIYEKIKP